MKLNLGCGDDYREGWMNIDYLEHFKVDLLLDLDGNPLSFKDNSVDFIHCGELLNYISHENTQKLIVEMWRVLKKGRLVEITLPHFSYNSAYGMKNRAFSISNFNTFCATDTQKYLKGIPQEAYENEMFKIKSARLDYQRTHIGNKCVVKKGAYYFFGKVISFFANLNPKFTERFWVYWFGGFQEFKVVLEKK